MAAVVLVAPLSIGPVRVEPARRRLLAAAATVALVALLVANRPPSPSHSSAASAEHRAEQAGIDVDGIVDRLSHGLIASGAGTFSTGDRDYRATFGPSGFAMAPTGQPDGLEIALRTASAGPWTAEGNIASRAVGPGLTEQVTTSQGAVEWDVVVARRPAGGGDLRIVAGLGGLAAARIVDGHWDLTVPGGGRLQMGALVVKDRTGRALYRALPAIDGDQLTMVVPAGILDGAQYPLVVDPTVSAERAVGTVRAEGNQSAPAVAWNGTVFLAAWLDDRELGNDIYVTRIAPTGGVLDTEGIPIPTGHFGTEAISVASDGTGFLVVWDEPRNGDHSKGDIFGTRVSAAGVVLDPLSINISIGAGDERFPSVAWNGTNFLVAFSSTGRVAATRVSAAGTVLDAGGFPLSDANGSQGLPAVTSDGTNWFVAWEDTRNGNADIFGTRVANDHSVLDGLGVPIATGTDPQQHATVAWNGTRYFVAWSRNDSSTVNIEGKRVSAAAVPVEATAIPLSSSILELDPAVAARGSTFVVTWTEFRLETSTFDIRATRVNGDGTVPDADGFAIGDSAGHETAPAIVNGASSLFAVWQDGGPALLEAMGARVSASGAVADPNGIVLSTQAPTHFEWNPAIAWNGYIFLVVWEDGRNPSLDIYGARIDASGAVLDAAGIPIAAATDGQYAPSVASNGSAFLVAWEDFRSGSTYDIYGSRVTAAGAVLGSGTPISTAANDQTHVAVGFNGTDYVVAWQDTRSGPAADIYGSRVSTGGAVRDPAGKALSTTTGDQITPSVASTTGTTLVVWTDARTGTADIRGTRVGTNGTALDPTSIAISTATRAQTNPVVAWTSGTYLVAWQDLRSGTTLDVYGARLNDAGSLLDANGIPISTAPGHQDEPAIAFNGTFLVVWRDGRSGSTYDVFAARVGTNGSVSDPSRFGVAAGSFHELVPAVAPGPGGTWSVVYLRSQFTGQGTYLRTVAPK